MQTHDRCEEGQQIILVSLMLPVLLLFVGLVIDVGNLYFHRRMAQNAADAAAMAGSARLPNKTDARKTALAYASTNGYDDGAGNTVTVNVSTCVHVVIDEGVRPLLVSLVWSGDFRVSAESEACMMTAQIGASVIILDDSRRDGALRIGGNSALVVERGNVHVNSSSPQAVIVGGSKSTIETETPATLVGSTDDLKAFTMRPITGAAVMLDPLRDLPTPTRPSPCSSKQVSETSDLVKDVFCYTGGISMNSSDKLELPAGIYWIEKGLSVNGSKTQLSGSGVMFYIAGGDVSIKKCSTCRLTPPGSGVYKDILFFGSHADPPSIDFSAGADLSIDGIIYNKHGALTISGGANINANFAVGTLDMTGNADLVVKGMESGQWATTEYRMTR